MKIALRTCSGQKMRMGSLASWWARQGPIDSQVLFHCYNWEINRLWKGGGQCTVNDPTTSEVQRQYSAGGG